MPQRSTRPHQPPGLNLNLKVLAVPPPRRMGPSWSVQMGATLSNTCFRTQMVSLNSLPKNSIEISPRAHPASGSRLPNMCSK